MKPLAITMGDPGGIGPEILIKAARAATGSPMVAIADPALLRDVAAQIAPGLQIVSVGISDLSSIHASDALPVLPLTKDVTSRPGTPVATDAPAVMESISRAVELVLDGRCSAAVTSPIAKATLYAEGFSFAGHTEFLGHLAEIRTGNPNQPVMMLAGPHLRTVPVTVHIPLTRVAPTLTSQLIVSTGRIVARDLKTRFGIHGPRLAVAGLNPHAGESGTIGDEDERIIQPAVEALQAEGIAASGPYPADTLFHAARRADYDAVLCMYHDQALIPVKTLAFDETVNVTLGLPFVRTSPDHGTAFDIAGQGIARPDSLIAAIRLAAELAL